MATIIIILLILAIYHFAYESIIAPSLRLELRYKLFGLRDRLRLLRFKKENEVPDNVFQHLENAVNSSIRHLPSLNISMLFDAKKEFENNEKLRQQIKHKIDLIDTCNDIEIKAISEMTTACSIRSFIINMGAWVIYLVPIFILLMAYSNLKTLIQKLSFTPQNQFPVFISDPEIAYS